MACWRCVVDRLYSAAGVGVQGLLCGAPHRWPSAPHMLPLTAAGCVCCLQQLLQKLFHFIVHEHRVSLFMCASQQHCSRCMACLSHLFFLVAFRSQVDSSALCGCPFVHVMMGPCVPKNTTQRSEEAPEVAAELQGTVHSITGRGHMQCGTQCVQSLKAACLTSGDCRNTCTL